MTPSWPARILSHGNPSAVPDLETSKPILPWAIRRDVLILVCVKLAALATIYWLFFAPHARPDPRPAEIAAHILDH